jgi:glycerophosphoryl diester phosphodiesterase
LDNYGLNFADILFDHLKAFSLETVEKSIETKIPIIIECFEPESLKKFSQLSDLPLILLMGEAALDMDLDDIAQYAHGVGPIGFGLFTKNFMAEAKSRELQVHAWYVRDEQLWWTENPIDENMFYFDSGVDGLFTEHPHMTMSVFKEKIEPKNSQDSIQ